MRREDCVIVDADGHRQHYDYLYLATGGLPHVVPYPMVPVTVEEGAAAAAEVNAFGSHPAVVMSPAVRSVLTTHHVDNVGNFMLGLSVVYISGMLPSFSLCLCSSECG